MDGSGEPAKPTIVTREDAAAELLKRRKITEKFHDFVAAAWPQFEGGRPFTDGWVIGAVCEHVQAVLEGQIRDLLINYPPRCSKSSIVSVCMQPFDWIHRPQTQYFCAAYSDKLTVRDHVKARRLMESRWYQLRWGDKFQLTDDQNTKVRYDNLQGGYRAASSIDGTVTGDGGDILVFDDPNSANDLGDAALEKAATFWQFTMPTRMNDFKTSRRIVVQQRLHEKDISGLILRDKGDWVHLMLPMEFEAKRRSITVKLPSTNGKRWQDPRQKEGELLWPERIDAPSLAKLKKELGTAYAVAGQLQQRPAPGEGGIMKRKWFQVWAQPSPPKLKAKFLSVDTAMSEKKEAADSAITAWGVFDHPDTKTPCVMLLAAWHDRVEYPELRERTWRMSRNYLDDAPIYDGAGNKTKPAKENAALKVDQTVIERKNNGISLQQELSKTGINLFGFNPDKLGDKVERVRLITPILESLRVWVPGSAASNYERPRKWAEDLVEQCAAFPKAAKRDLVDTMVQVLWRLHISGWIWVSGDPEPEPEYTNPGGQDDGEPIYG